MYSVSKPEPEIVELRTFADRLTVHETTNVGYKDKARRGLPFGNIHVVLDEVVVDYHHRGLQNGKSRVDTKHEKVDEKQTDPVLSPVQLPEDNRPGSWTVKENSLRLSVSIKRQIQCSSTYRKQAKRFHREPCLRVRPANEPNVQWH